jgi:hypothetical protein
MEHIELARISKGLAALRDFGSAYRRYGSTPEGAVWALMSAFTGCGHSVA